MAKLMVCAELTTVHFDINDYLSHILPQSYDIFVAYKKLVGISSVLYLIVGEVWFAALCGVICYLESTQGGVVGQKKTMCVNLCVMDYELWINLLTFAGVFYRIKTYLIVYGKKDARTALYI